jgi:HAD superfamily phosphatase
VGEALVLRSSIGRIADIEGVVFDMDGVLINTDEAARQAHGAAAEAYFMSIGWSNCAGMVRPRDVDAFKLAGGFNSDWDAVDAWTLLYLFKSRRYGSTDGSILRSFSPTLEEFADDMAKRGGGLSSAVDIIRGCCSPDEWQALEAAWDRSRVRRVFIETYGGDLCFEMYGLEPETVTGPGMVRKEKPILDRRRIPDSLKLGVATGRNRGEASVGLRLMGWADLFSPQNIITEDDGFLKPDPRILALAVERIGARHPIYIGDTPDDLLTARRYEEHHGEMLSCMVLSGMRHPAARERFVSGRADMIADNVNAALAVIQHSIAGCR